MTHIENQELRARLAREYPVYTNTACQARNDGYVCTREAGHDGQHVAHIGADSVCAVWEKEA